MKNYRVFTMLAVLVLASLSCQAASGLGGDKNAPSEKEVPSGNSSNSEFPMTSDAFNVTDIGNGSVLYYTKMSMEDVMKFYRDEYTAKGYKEREILTTVSDGIFSMVFDGDPSGKAVVIQSVDLGDGSRTVAIRLEDV